MATKRNAEAERRIEEAGRLRSKRLDLAGLRLPDLPPALSDLVELRFLDLSLTGVEDLSRLSDLTHLEVLDLRFDGVTDLSPLSGLAALHSLKVSSTPLADLSALSSLEGLRTLDLSATKVADLSALSGHSRLQNLEFASTKVEDISVLSGLVNLETLNLSYQKLTDLSVLSGFTRLRELHFAGAGTMDLSMLSDLVDLLILDLGGKQVANLSALSNLRRLRFFCALASGLTDLSTLSGLTSLRSLFLYSFPFPNVSALSGLAGLQCLNLSSSSVTDLSVLSSLPRLKELDVWRCPLSIPASLVRDLVTHPRLDVLTADNIVGVPREILSRHTTENCLPRLRAWHAEFDAGRESDNEVKVILLGNGHVGKTQLCRRFRGEQFDAGVESTHGVQIWRESLCLDTADGEQTFMVNWWDFGGQDIYHGTHALFLRSRAVFVLLWTPQFENTDEADENGIPMRNQPLRYWLDYVRSLAGADSPIIVVQSRCDTHRDRARDPQRPEGFGFFETCAYSALNDRGREALESYLREAIRYVQDRSGALEIGAGRAEVRRRLYAWRSADQQRRPDEREHRTLTQAQFQALCEEVGGIVSWEHALDYFHQTGVVFHRNDLFSDGIILDQDWALDAVYSIFHRARAVPWLQDSGRFTREDLAAIVWQAYSPEQQQLFLGLMESCGVCFRCGSTGRGETRYVAPDLLPGIDRVHLPAWNKAAETVALELDYRFFHVTTMRKLMSEVAHEAGERAEYWKYGIWFKDGKRGAQVRIRFVETGDEASPGAGVLIAEAQGDDPFGLLAEIRRSIVWHHGIGESPQERLTLNGTTVAHGALGTFLDGKMVAVDKTPVPGDRYAALFEERSREAAIDIDPRPIVPGDKLPEVYISYAWGDDSEAGKVRTETVNALQASLEGDGFAPVRDQDQMRTGDRISAFLRRLTRADLVVTLISDKYLRSYYCMYEIYGLWQKAQADADQMLERVVPIILPEVRVGSFEEREPYLKYWSDKAKHLDALIRNPDLRPSEKSWKEVRLVREFADHVDDILIFLDDVLMPRNLHVHLNGGFEAVCDALRRRLATTSRNQ